jgi:Protein of unknown function (DUF3800)
MGTLSSSIAYQFVELMNHNPTHLVFLDESGDHNLQVIDPQFPVFCLASVIFEYDKYLDIVNPKIDRLKYKYWGDKSIIFHTSDIRKQRDRFKILFDQKKRGNFNQDLYDLLKNLELTIIAAGINKDSLKSTYSSPESPYDLTLEFIMERIFFYFKNVIVSGKCVLVVESRGEKENKDLYRVFHNLMNHGSGQRNQTGIHINSSEFKRHIIDLVFRSKSLNENGNQIADLIAYPIAKSIIDGSKNNLYNAFESRFYYKSDNTYDGYGLKIFP